MEKREGCCSFFHSRTQDKIFRDSDFLFNLIRFILNYIVYYVYGRKIAFYPQGRKDFLRYQQFASKIINFTLDQKTSVLILNISHNYIVLFLLRVFAVLRLIAQVRLSHSVSPD
jgi:hypothetical protein